ncbi:ead/Ea22-like family protein [Escherichia coli]|nr:ead/Ea22-like family protein [Escherichia coli]
MKQMSLIEMDGFLKGKCIPRDLKVNETNVEYLVRKFAEAEAKISALSEDQQKAIESIKQADAAVKLAHEKFSALATENATLKAVCENCRTFIMNGVLLGFIQMPTAEIDPALETIRVALSPQKPIPATDAFLSEVRAQGVEMLAKNHQSIVNALKGNSLFSDGEYRHAAIVSAAVYFAAELRKGGCQ